MILGINLFVPFFYLFLTSLAISNNLIELLLSWVGLNVSLYVLFVRGSLGSVEAGLKYFLVGLLLTCFLFFSTIIIYLEYLTVDFNYFNFINYYGIGSLGTTTTSVSFTQRLIVILIILSLLFKLGVFPFNFYLNDIYASLNWHILYIYTIPLKIVIFSVLIKFLLVFASYADIIYPIVVWSAIGSVLIGTISSIKQLKLRLFWANSYLSTIGYTLLGLGYLNGGSGIVTYTAKIYLIVYLLTWHALVSVFHLSRYEGKMKNLNEIRYVSQLPILLTEKSYEQVKIIFFSLISLMGLPPALGFYSKFLIYLNIFESNYSIFLIFLLILSPIGGLGYLRLLLSLLFSKTKLNIKINNISIFCGFFSGWETVLVIFYIPALVLVLPISIVIFSIFGKNWTDYILVNNIEWFWIFSELFTSTLVIVILPGLLLLNLIQWLI